MTQQPARANKRQMGVGGEGGALRGSNAPRGQAAEAGQQEALLQLAGTLRGGCLSRGWMALVVQLEATPQPARENKRQMGGGRWEMEAARQEAGMRQEDERQRQCNNQPDKRHWRPWHNECNSNERGWSRWKTQQPTMGGRGNGGWRLQSCRLTGDNTTTSQGGQEQDATRGRGGGEGKLADVRWRCHKRQRSNQSGQTRGKQEVELPRRREAATCQEAAVLTRGQEAEAA